MVTVMDEPFTIFVFFFLLLLLNLSWFLERENREEGE
jgi:hypothetical protein